MRLREFRMDRGFTQKDMADRLGCSVVAYQRYEAGSREPSIDVLKQLSAILSVSIDYLVDNVDAKTEVYEQKLVEAARHADDTSKSYALEILLNHQV